MMIPVMSRWRRPMVVRWGLKLYANAIRSPPYHQTVVDDPIQQEIKFVWNSGCMDRDHGATFRDAANRTIHD